MEWKKIWCKRTVMGEQKLSTLKVANIPQQPSKRQFFSRNWAGKIGPKLRNNQAKRQTKDEIKELKTQFKNQTRQSLKAEVVKMPKKLLRGKIISNNYWHDTRVCAWTQRTTFPWWEGSKRTSCSERQI